MLQKKLIVLFCLWFAVCFGKYQYHLSIGMIFRDEAPYLKEWIEFHRLVGVEHFYLCSHNSQDHYKEVLEPYITKGIVELEEWMSEELQPDSLAFTLIQCSFYNECLNKARGVSKWIAILDSDEFLFCPQGKSLVDVLQSYKEFAGIGVNWQMFGTSYIDILQPDKLMIEQLVCCAPRDMKANAHIKSIVQPKWTTHFLNPHNAEYLPGYMQVNTDKVPFQGPLSPYVQVNRLRINHYWTRDNTYFRTKKTMRQNQFWGFTRETVEKLAAPFNEEVDMSIQQFVPKLRKKMGLKS